MKKNIFVCISLLITSMSFSQNTSQAKEILDKVCNVYEKSKGILLDFKITSTDANGTSQPSQSGKAYIKGNKFKLEMDAMDTWFDGKTQWVLMKDSKEVNISNPTSAEIAAISPLALLGMYKKGFMLKKPISKTINGRNAYLIEMTPTQECDFKHLAISVDKKTNAVLQVKATMINGYTSTINISKYNTSNNFSDTLFVFNKTFYPDVEIIDLR